MTSWQTKKLSELLTIRHGRNQREVEARDGEYPILGTGGEMGRANKFLYDKPSVLIGRKGTIDKPRYMDTPFWTVDTLFYSEMKPGVDAKFMYYFFNTVVWKRYNEASGVPSLSASTISSIKTSVPEKPEQQRIVAVLEVWDEYIEKLERKIALKEQLKKALMTRFFIPSKNSVPLRSLLASFSTGLNPRTNFKLGTGTNYYITIKNISRGKLHFANAEKVDDNAISLIAKRSKLAKDDVIMSSIGNVGEAYLLRSDPNGWNINESVFALKPDVSKILPEYLYYLITSSYAKRFFDGHITGSSFKSIKMKDLREMPVNNISIDDQQAIVDVLGAADRELDILNQIYIHVMNQKKYLLINLITGTVPTPENLAPLPQQKEAIHA